MLFIDDMVGRRSLRRSDLVVEICDEDSLMRYCGENIRYSMRGIGE
jgi:hypothetical protein